MTISFHLNSLPEPQEVADLLIEGGFLRPLDDLNRVERMLERANIIVTVRDDQRIIGFCRALSDGAYYCLIAEVVVATDYKGKKIGKTMLELVQREAGDEVNFVLTSSVEGETFYRHIGWEQIDRAFRLKRKR
ncbi:MAG: GNAT family N-acetyltransferase [SAR202 cluster bacterium]|mgnify:CR=1 FL=1|nr:GNAT family N-acetyltransferase [SAR202 cluster bacterium]|tara:strand:- start:2589 stop:2987 length:399 start_codon:yes stop_codon:yes gene_type:complete